MATNKFKRGDKVRYVGKDIPHGIYLVTEDDSTSNFVCIGYYGRYRHGWLAHPREIELVEDEAPPEVVADANSLGGHPHDDLPTRLPHDPASRKRVPLATGLVDYFPDALIAVAELSRIGNEQHSPGQPLHWDRTKSTDEDDALMRHFVERGTRDTDGARHRTKVAWRALAALQKEIESEVV